jgi:hypothetical protein
MRVNWRTPITQALKVQGKAQGIQVKENIFKLDPPTELTTAQSNITTAFSILLRASKTDQLVKWSQLVMNFELMAFAIMWYGIVSTAIVSSGQLTYIYNFFTQTCPSFTAKEEEKWVEELKKWVLDNSLTICSHSLFVSQVSRVSEYAPG